MLWEIWHPNYGMLFDEYENIKKRTCPQPSLIMVEEMIEGEDGRRPPPEQYSYRCSRCRLEMEVNEAIIDVEIGIAEFEGDG